MVRVYPTEARASWFSRYFNCGEESCIKATMRILKRDNVQFPPAYWGTWLHRRLDARFGTPEMEQLKNILAGIEPLSFRFEDIRVFFHPDDYRVRGKLVSVVEEKTVTPKKKKILYIDFCVHQFQLKTYVYGIQEILSLFDYRLSLYHHLRYWHRQKGWEEPFRLFRAYRFKIGKESLSEIEGNLSHILEAWRGEIAPELPMPFKCKRCSPYYKSRCRYYLRELPISTHEWNRRFR